MSSCVYSLFPIYTKESLVYLDEIEGEWTNKDGIRLLFAPVEANVSITVEPGDDEYIIEDGDTIRDIEKVAAYWQNELQKEIDPELSQFVEKGYFFQTIENDDTLKLKVKIAKIGENHFMDFYPSEEYDEEFMDHNLFPVHTFMKVEVSEQSLILTPFDLNKLVDLFESNKIRLRHEKINGAIMITAQPKEIQKFLTSYSRDLSVFQSPELYTKVGP